MRTKAILLTVIVSLLCSTAVCAGYDGTDGVTYIPITGTDFVVDSLDGVPAMYGSSRYQCSEYVSRYYSQVYGIDMDFSGSGPISKTPGYSFETLDTQPRTGDIAFIPGYNRGKSYGHWAIVKSCQDGWVTLIEQNWSWAGMAAYARQISWPSSGYIFYRLTDGETSSFPSSWAKDAVQLCAQLGLGDGLHQDYRKAMSRLEFCCLLMETVNCISPRLVSEDLLYLFSDTVSPSVSQAASLGIISQSADFRPDDPVTRQEAAVMLSGAVAALGCSCQATDTDPLALDDTVSPWALEAVKDMLDLGFFICGDDGSFMARDTVEVQHGYVLMVHLYDHARSCNGEQPCLSAAQLAAGATSVFSKSLLFAARP